MWPSSDSAYTYSPGVKWWRPPTYTVQDASELAGAVVRDCRPSLLPVSMRVPNIGQWPIRRILPVTPSAYPEPPVPAEMDVFSNVGSRVSPLRVAVDRPILDLFPLYLTSPVHSDYDSVTSPVSPSLQGEGDFLLPNSPATVGQDLPGDSDLLLGDVADLPLLALPLLPLQTTDNLIPGSSVVSLAGEPVVVSSDIMPDLSREGPFDLHQDTLELGATPRVIESLPVYQFHMTSYHVAGRSDLDPAYGLHLHDP